MGVAWPPAAVAIGEPRPCCAAHQATLSDAEGVDVAAGEPHERHRRAEGPPPHAAAALGVEGQDLVVLRDHEEHGAAAGAVLEVEGLGVDGPAHLGLEAGVAAQPGDGGRREPRLHVEAVAGGVAVVLEDRGVGRGRDPRAGGERHRAGGVAGAHEVRGEQRGGGGDQHAGAEQREADEAAHRRLDAARRWGWSRSRRRRGCGLASPSGGWRPRTRGCGHRSGRAPRSRPRRRIRS
jgi:hypothetical protein